MPFGPVRVAVTPRREVTFLSDDSVHLRGTYWEPPEEGAASLLLIHDFGSNRKVWNPYVAMFHSRGWGVMTFDLRGHGESVRQDMHAALLEPEAQDLAAETYARDVRAAISFLARQPKSDAARIGISGVGAGSDLAYAAAGRGWGAASTVLFGLDEPRARIFSGYGPFAPRSVYLLVRKRERDLGAVSRRDDRARGVPRRNVSLRDRRNGSDARRTTTAGDPRASDRLVHQDAVGCAQALRLNAPRRP